MIQPRANANTCLGVMLVCLALLALAPALPVTAKGNFAGRTARPLRYRPVGTDFVITNGAEFFNRPLYGGNTAFRVDAGDRPEFSLYLPGRGGNLRLGFKTGTGQKWLADATQIEARYRPGSMIYEIRDPLLRGGELRVTAIAFNSTEGLLLRVELSGATAPVTLVWAYGGVNGVRGRRDGDIGTEQVPMSQFFQLKPEFCRDNTFVIEDHKFRLHSKAATIAGLAPAGSKLTVADANQWASLDGLLASTGAIDKPPALAVVVGQTKIDSKPFFIALQRIAQDAPALTDLPTYREITRDRAGPAAPARATQLLPAYNVEQLPMVFTETEAARQELAARLVVDTPDPYINAAAAALTLAADAVWDEPQGAFMHGAVAWRTKLLGWRGPYSGDALGWHERARRHLSYWAGRQNIEPVSALLAPDPTVNFARNEPALHTNGDLSNSHYDMNLVYIDALFRHYLWTGDLEFARETWPVIERHLAWERRLFRRPFGPEQLPLYEAYAATWASDDLQYEGGGVTHATAYNYYHNKMAGRIARLLGKDGSTYEREAELIQRALRHELWLKDRGWYAEWKDLLGRQLVHPNAALWTFYHTVDSEVPAPFEAWQMSRFVDTQIAHIPVEGPGVPRGNYYTLPTTSWMPYTWSTNNVVMAEANHTALAYWQTGRSEEAFRLFKGSLLDSMFMGLCPGNVGMATTFDMARGESQRDFADAVGVTSRTLIEGLFGVQPDALAGELVVTPGFPDDWGHARLRHPDFTFAYRRDGLIETYSVEPRFSRPLALRLRVAAHRDAIARVAVNGRAVKWQLIADSVGRPRVEIQGQRAPGHEVVITWKGAAPALASVPEIVAHGQEFQARLTAGQFLEIADPQNCLSNLSLTPTSLRATAVGALGHRTVFARIRQGELSWWHPLIFELRPTYEIRQSEKQTEDTLRFVIHNNTRTSIDREVVVRTGADAFNLGLKAPALSASKEIEIDAKNLWPGTNPVTVSLGGGATAIGEVTNWRLPAADTIKLEPLNLSPVFNDKVTRIFQQEYLRPRSPYCSLAIPKQGIGSWARWSETFVVDDSGLRATAGRNRGRLLLPQGVPFQTPGMEDTPNIAFTSMWDNYPREIAVQLHGRAAHVYLLMAGSTNSMQSRFDNGEVLVTYADGSESRLALHNPTTWWPIDQDYFIDDFAFRRPEPLPPRVDLQTGLVRVLDAASFKGRGGKITGGAATVLDLPLDSNKELKKLTVRTLANEVVIGLMAVTIARS
jgi:hypothetical protein